MRQHLVAASLLFSISTPAMAQGGDNLRDGLAHLPASLLVQAHGDIAYFVDIEALNGLAAGGEGAQPFARIMSGAEINGLVTYAGTEPAEWESKAGTSGDTLRYFTGYGRQPNGVSFWGLTNESAAEDMIANLATLGFEAAGAPGVIGNGEPMRFDPQKRDPADPWRTRVGAAQFAVAKGNTVIQAQNPQEAALAAADQPALGEQPAMQVVLDGLEAAAGDASIVQAVVISPLFGLTGLDPAAVLSMSGDMSETRQNIEAQMAELDAGIPPYMGGIVADLGGERQGVVMALAYPDCTIAGEAADQIAERWVAMAGEAAQGEIATDTAEGADGLCAATVSVAIEPGDAAQNPAYRAIIDRHFRNEAGVLQIGTNG